MLLEGHENDGNKASPQNASLEESKSENDKMQCILGTLSFQCLSLYVQKSKIEKLTNVCTIQCCTDVQFSTQLLTILKFLPKNLKHSRLHQV